MYGIPIPTPCHRIRVYKSPYQNHPSQVLAAANQQRQQSKGTHLCLPPPLCLYLSRASDPLKSKTRERTSRARMVRMEKLALAQQQQQQCEMELVKAAMLKHEETFRQQVHDLHRLYRVQKQLMSDLTRRPSTPRQQGQRRGSRQHPRRPELKYPQLPVDDEHTVSRGTTSTDRQVIPPSTESEDELQLTLALGGSGSQRRRRESTPSSTTDGSLLQTPSSSTGSSGALHQRAAACDLRREGAVAKAKQQPQWLLRCLSLRMA
uniref:Uncharacterized protein n=1 Tax=Avena sativa TaxID=4498 RepID=A0ACD5X4Z5_AVESA